MNQQVREEIATELLGAYQSREPVEPLTGRYPALDLDDAYEIQLLQVGQWRADGARVKGHKVGLTSAAMQRPMGVDTPDFGVLLDSMFVAEGVTCDITRFLQPRAEPEIAFVLGKPLAGPGVTTAEAVAAIDFVLPALELIDSRIADWKITLPDTIADNGSSGGLVLGSQAGEAREPGPVADGMPAAPQRPARRHRRGRRRARRVPSASTTSA